MNFGFNCGSVSGCGQPPPYRHEYGNQTEESSLNLDSFYFHPPLDESPQIYVTPETVINALPTYRVWKKSPFMKSEYKCELCLQKYNEGDYVRCLPCKHKFHVYCIENWLRWVKSSCPVDKEMVVKSSFPTESKSQTNGEEECGVTVSHFVDPIQEIVECFENLNAGNQNSFCDAIPSQLDPIGSSSSVSTQATTPRSSSVSRQPATPRSSSVSRQTATPRSSSVSRQPATPKSSSVSKPTTQRLPSQDSTTTSIASCQSVVNLNITPKKIIMKKTKPQSQKTDNTKRRSDNNKSVKSYLSNKHPLYRSRKSEDSYDCYPSSSTSNSSIRNINFYASLSDRLEQLSQPRKWDKTSNYTLRPLTLPLFGVPNCASFQSRRQRMYSRIQHYHVEMPMFDIDDLNTYSEKIMPTSRISSKIIDTKVPNYSGTQGRSSSPSVVKKYSRQVHLDSTDSEIDSKSKAVLKEVKVIPVTTTSTNTGCRKRLNYQQPMAKMSNSIKLKELDKSPACHLTRSSLWPLRCDVRERLESSVATHQITNSSISAATISKLLGANKKYHPCAIMSGDTKEKRKMMSLGKKLEIISRIEADLGASAIGHEFGVNDPMVCTIPAKKAIKASVQQIKSM